MNRAVKYCGGCNPRYDRAALVRRLEKNLGERLSSAQPGLRYDELYVVCGCKARCATLTGLEAQCVRVFDSDETGQGY